MISVDEMYDAELMELLHAAIGLTNDHQQNSRVEPRNILIALGDDDEWDIEIDTGQGIDRERVALDGEALIEWCGGDETSIRYVDDVMTIELADDDCRFLIDSWLAPTMREIEGNI